MAHSPAIQINNLTKSYGDKHVLTGLNLDVPTGTVLALLGPNGAGKTTTVEILQGLRRPGSGTVSVLGQDPQSGSRAWRARIGVVSQSSKDMEKLTVTEAITHVARFYSSPADVAATIEQVGLSDDARTRLSRLSGGRRRRLDVGVAIVGVPALMVDGLPQLGADVGGALTLVAALIALGTALAGGRIGWKQWMGVAVVAVVATGIFGLVDHALGSRTHMGRFIGQLQDGTAATTIRRKLLALVNPFFSSPLAVAALFVGLAVIGAGAWWLRREVRAWRAGLSGYATLTQPEVQVPGGVGDRPRSAEDTLATSSPSMDISKASNLERFIWALLGPEAFVRRWEELEATGTLDLRDQLPRLRDEFGFVAGTSSHADRLKTIRSVKKRSGRLIDPHTADGVTVALRTMEPGFPTLVMETAKAAKFPQTVAEALGSEPETPDVVADLLARPQKVETIDNEEAPLRALIEERALTR